MVESPALKSLYLAAAGEHSCKGKSHPDTDCSCCKGLGYKCIHSCQGSAWAHTLDREQAITHKVLVIGSHITGRAQEALNLRKCFLVSGTWIHPLCCPDLRPGGSDSNFSPGSPAAAVRRPQTATSLTHTSSCLYPSGDYTVSLNCPPPRSSAQLAASGPIGKRFLPTYFANSGGTKGSHRHKCKKELRC